MNERVRLTGNPDRASRIRTPPPVIGRDHDTITGDWFSRAMPLAGQYDPETLEVGAIVATNTPVLRKDARGPFLEILDPTGLEFDATDDWPLLEDHHQSARKTAGIARDLVIDGPSIRATLRLTAADDAEPLRQRIKDGSLRHVSAGYRVLAWAETRNPDGTRTKTATRWRLLEVSLVPIPADRNAIIFQRSGTMTFDLETRAVLIEKLRSACKLPDEWGEDLDAEAVTDDEVRAAALEAMLTRQAPTIRVTRSHDNPAEIQTRAADALAYRMGGIAELPEASREFANMSLMDHAKDALARVGISTRGMSADEVIHRSLTTSDFPLTVSNAANKTAADAYRTAESPLKVLFRQRGLSDFKTATSVRLGGMGMLEEMTESGEFTATSRGEEGETLQLRTFGRRLDLTRRLIVNDDLGLFGDTTRALGEAAAATEAQLMADLLAGSGTLSDGTPLFHASRGNIVSAQPSAIDDLSAARLVMRQQKNLDGATPIQAVPKYVVAGPEMETLLEKALGVITPPDSDSYNPFASRLQLLIEPRLDGSDWFVFADPSQCAVFNIAHLAAAPGPQIQRSEQWDTLGVSFRVWMDVGTGFAGWRGAVKVDNA